MRYLIFIWKKTSIESSAVRSLHTMAARSKHFHVFKKNQHKTKHKNKQTKNTQKRIADFWSLREEPFEKSTITELLMNRNLSSKIWKRGLLLDVRSWLQRYGDWTFSAIIKQKQVLSSFVCLRALNNVLENGDNVLV